MKKYTQLKNDRINLRDAIPLEKPFTILFEPASLCNFRCINCYYSRPDLYSYMAKGFMRFDNFKKIVDDLSGWAGEKIKVIRIIGFGEPFMNKETGHMVKYLKQMAVAERVEITTNASLMTTEVCRQLVESKLDYIRISIYSVFQERHEQTTGSKIDIDVIRNHVAELKRIRDEAGSLFPFIYVKMLDYGDEMENNKFIATFKEISDEVALEKPHQWLANEDPARGQEDACKNRQICPQPFKMLSIRCNGDVIVCDPDWMNNTCVGNAFDSSIKEIWNGEKLHAFWQMQLENRRNENASCRTCTFLHNQDYVLDDIDGVSPDILRRDEV